MPSREEILEKVRATLVDALGVDDTEVTPESTLTGDLGAESIDFLDIVFRLEKNFSIKVPRGDLFPEDMLNDAQFVAEGKLTAKGMDEIRRRMPWADFSHLDSNAKVQDLWTVGMVVRYIESKLASKGK
jgi:acyl carrier protein